MKYCCGTPPCKCAVLPSDFQGEQKIYGSGAENISRFLHLRSTHRSADLLQSMTEGEINENPRMALASDRTAWA